ncbi:ABC transporter permease [Anaerotignum lactatifermentans]|uniref:Putative ABC transport system permease protein n=1 Tax=Anaerotignum lactatifermentans DSM 14214 TaxID=1121323 RepID=A0A1M6MZC2_9FIRM|nr:ABC transporter permease [Anaerotignum lactatifermentans]SHJ88673.1 putative ABC transport system permease protein [[Clostridium] lactatifermentans DSM 14214] [Anaerotignum lactatifermentans DSM 14214]
MTSFKLIFKNVHKNLRDYLIYFLTLMISVSLFYAFNSISDQPAFSEMGMTRTLLYDQLGILLSALSVLIAIVLAFLIIYANQFLLKRRKKELGIYMMLGMKKGRISRIFAGETFCVGVIALAVGLILGFILSQGVSLIALKLFAIELDKYQLAFSMGAFRQTIICFALIFFLVMLFNVWSVSSVQLIDLLTASRKNERLKSENRVLPVLMFLLSILCIGIAGVLFYKNGILPSRENMSFQIAGLALVVGTILLFYSFAAVFIQLMRSNKGFYLKGLNTFLVRQIGSKIRTNYFVMTVVCGLLTITICAVSIGASTALAMNKLSQAATPYDLTVISDVSIDGDSDITDYLATCDVQMSDYAKNMEQISVYDADMTYADLFAGQDLNLWPIDEAVPQSRVSVISISDFNRALAMQGKGPVTLNEGEYLLNCNYEGTYQYVIEALRTYSELSVGGVALQRASDEVLQETYVMTSVGNNDRGTLIVPDSVVTALPKDVNALLVQYKEETNPDEVLQKMIPIGLDETHGYRYSEKNMLYDMFYGINALVTFICCYVGLIFLLICAALLALKQLTETTDNIFRYGLLQKLGAKRQQINHTLFVQTGVFFTVPLVVAGLYSILLIGKGMEIVEEFMNIHIATNVWLTVILFLIVYGSYFIATYLSCKRMVTEQKEMEV